jgi:hypothetical protein
MNSLKILEVINGGLGVMHPEMMTNKCIFSIVYTTIFLDKIIVNLTSWIVLI